jgi:hypothetical protein
MRLFLASLIFLATVLDMNFGSAVNALDVAALSAGLLLAGSVVVDFVWLDRPNARPQARDAPPPPQA